MDHDRQRPRSFALIAAIFEGGLAVLAVGLGWLLDEDPLGTFHFSAAAVGGGLLATLPALAVVGLCLKWPIGPFGRILQVLDEMLIPLFRDCRIVELAVICLLAGLGEEMLFRGIVQQGIQNWIGGTAGLWSGLIAAAVLFGLVHRITNTYALLAGAMGIYFGWIWLWTDSLLVPIIAHAAYDFIVLVYLVRYREPPAC